MKPRYLAVCPCCHEFYAPQKDPSTHSCDECGCTLKPVDYDFGMYSALSDEAKKEFKRKYIAEHFPEPYRKPFEPLPLSGWVGTVGCFGWVTFIGLLIIGVLSLPFGFAAGIALLIAAPISGGALILFSIVAEDVRHIRNQVDKLHHDQKYNK